MTTDRSTTPPDLRPGHTESGPVPFRAPDQAIELAVEARIGVRFHQPILLRQALTHRSVLHDWQQHQPDGALSQSNERLEFLGDAVLGLIAGEFLYTRLPNANEGTLTRNRAALVRAETLVRWSLQLGLPDALYVGTGETITGNPRDRYLATAFEALVGAIYLDQGLEAARSFLHPLLEHDVADVLTEEISANPKGDLQELVQERRLDQPVYETLDERGPDHARSFRVAVLVDGHHVGEGEGRSKREAQQAAAREALKRLTANEAG